MRTTPSPRSGAARFRVVLAFTLLFCPDALAASKIWNGGGDGFSWGDPVNWNGGTLPGPTSDVIIPIVAGNPVIEITDAAEARSVRGSPLNQPLSPSQPIRISGGGSLTLGAASSISALAVESGTLAGAGTGTAFDVSVTGATTLVGANLFANGGAVLSLTSATSYTGDNYADTTIQASGAGSRINLSGLADFTGGGYYDDYRGRHYSATHVLPTAGGRIDLAGAVTAAGYSNDFTVSGAGSMLGVNGITSFDYTDLVVDTAGATLDFTMASSLTAVSMSASGGAQILFPAATSYTGHNHADTTIQASGTGSRINLSNLTTFTGGGYYDDYRGRHYSTTHVLPTAGGRIDLAGAVTAAGYNNDITVSGAGSIFGVSGITSLSWTDLTVPISLTFDNVTALDGGSLKASAGATLNFPVAAAITAVSMTAIGGGQILFPAATSYTGDNYADTTIQATGAGSRINLSTLMTFTGGGYYDNYQGRHYFTTHVLPTGGGRIDLAGAVTAAGYNNNFTVSGAGSMLGVSGITSLDSTDFTASGAGCVLDLSPLPLAGIDGASVSMNSQNGGMIDLGNILTAASDLTLSATFGSASDVPFAFDGGSGMGKTLNLALNFAPVPGTALTVLKSSGAPAMNKFFANLGQFQVVSLPYGSQTYSLRANYHGGSGADLVLEHPGSFRLLPPKVAIGVPTTVAIVVLPMASNDGYVVEDVPPSGWLVTNISNGGVYDSVSGRVRWEFTDHASRTLTYDVTPTTGAASFAGSGSFDEQVCNVFGSVESTVVATLAKPELALLPFRLPSGAAALSLAARPGHLYVVEVSLNLKDWQPLFNTTVTTGALPFLDPGASGQLTRFYRAGEQ